MEGQDLEVRVSVDSQYYKDFLKIIEKDRLTISELGEYDRKSETPVIGRIMDDYNDFKKVLILERFMGFEEEERYNKKGTSKNIHRLWINTGSVEDDFKIAIGKKDKDFLISKRPEKEKITSYYLFDIPFKNGSGKLIYKNKSVDKKGRKLNMKGYLVDKDDNVLEDKHGNFIGDYNDIVWLVDIPKKWTKIPNNFLQETYELLGIKQSG